MTTLAIQQYPLKKPLPKIDRHDQLPSGSMEIGRLLDSTANAPGYEDLFIFVRRSSYLSILKSYTLPLKTGPKYACNQFDFPLKVLSWFPKALEEFRKPPIQGGLPAGAMISPDQNVDGEMLAVGKTTDGFFLVNRSRQDNSFIGGEYLPIRLSMSSEFLYQFGFLGLWKKLGEQYERGQF